MTLRRIMAASGIVVALFILLANCGTNSAVPGPGSPPSEARPWALVWSDEFAGANGSSPDATKWTFDIGGGGWGNDELETYTKRTENAYLEDGMLVIQALKETYTGPDRVTREYTSARLKTKGLGEWTYGKVEVRMKLPAGQGLWPAFWMLGANIDQAGWPGCGEIDIMENIGREPSIAYATIHGQGYSDGGGIGSAYTRWRAEGASPMISMSSPWSGR